MSLAQALLDKRVVAGLAATNPALALALQTMRLRVLLRQHIAVAYARTAATAAGRSAEDVAFYRSESISGSHINETDTSLLYVWHGKR